jgi:predicted dehydrogenase
MAKPKKVRYAVLGQGYFAQAAVLPAFAAAKRNSELVALVSDDPAKLGELGDQYAVEHRLGYGELDEFLARGLVDAVYIVLPNHMHREYTERAAAAGMHVLCEKPMALSEADCRAMIEACEGRDRKLMIAYRLHFEAANLTAVQLLRDETIGEPRLFSSVFCMQVNEGNIRLSAEHGGGPLNDIGIYCLNASRYLFREEPVEVTARAFKGDDPRFAEVDEAIAVTLRYGNGKVAQFTASFGAAGLSRYTVVGTKGILDVEDAYEFSSGITHKLKVGEEKPKTKKFAKRDQVAAELLYFSKCVLDDTQPEPSGWEGLADVRIMDAIRESVRTGEAIALTPIEREERPDLDQELEAPPHGMPELVEAETPSQN